MQYIDYYVSANTNAYGALDITGAALFQSFTGNGTAITGADFFMYKAGTPSNSATVKIYAHSGTYGTSSVPTGAVLATSDGVVGTTVLTSARRVFFPFTGANQITLTNGTYYCAVITYDGDGTNKLLVGHDTTSPTHSGNKGYYFGGWNAQSTQDMVFGIYSGTRILAGTGVGT